MTDQIGTNTLKGAKITFASAVDGGVLITADDLTWSLKINYDADFRELIFDTVMAPNMWLAIGLANNLVEADVIKWVSGAHLSNTSDLNTLENMLAKRSQSKVEDCISVRGELLENNKNLLRSIV